MSEPNPLPSWVEPGEPVVVMRRSNRNRAVQDARIDRITKTLVITDDGQRFKRRATTSVLEYTSGGAWDGVTYRLAPADDPTAAQWRAELKHEARVSKARSVCDDFARQRVGVQAPDVILAMLPLIGDEAAATIRQVFA